MKNLGNIVKAVSTIALTTLLFTHASNAQDVHFSQFVLSPMTFNPGMTGVVNADFRASVGYKNQWPGVAPFTTYTASADGSFNIKKGSDALLALGGHIYRDMAGDLNLGTFSGSLFVGSILPLNRNSELSLGLSAGMLQRSLSPGNMIWDSQYINGQFNANNASGESLRFAPLTSPDFGAGVAYNFRRGTSTLSSNDYLDMTFGFGLMHVNKPSIGFAGAEDLLPMKMTGHGDVMVGVTNTNFSFRPGFLYSRQGPFQEIVVGTYWSVLMREASKRTGFISAARFSLGTHYRVGDAFIPSVFIEVAEYKLGISYDVNTSGLTSATSGKGGIEITFMYTNPASFYYKRKRRGTSFL